jgi:hypothetical protein
MNTMLGAFVCAWAKRSRTRAAPTPTNISTKSEPVRLKKGTPASPATALASRVFPVPGAPTRSTPFGILPPSRRYRSGFFRKSTISISSARASSIPAMSSKLTPVWCSTYTFARLLPMDIIPLWGFIRFMTTIQSPTKITAGRIHDSSVAIHVFVTCPVNPTWAASSSGTSPGSSTRVVTKPGTLFPDRVISSIFSFERTPSRPVGENVPSIVSR